MRLRQLLFLLAISGMAHAEDSVRITYRNGVHVVPVSIVQSEIVITRTPIGDNQMSTTAATDRFFSSIGQLLDEARTPASWGGIGIHSASVRVDIQIGKRRHELTTSIGDDGLELWSPHSESDKRQVALMKSVISLAQALQTNLIGGKQ
jgi:hypothetical protein